MAFEERLSLLLSEAYEDYNEMVRIANFLNGDVEELSERITTARKLLEHMESSLSGCYSDVEALLFYDMPTSPCCSMTLPKAPTALFGTDTLPLKVKADLFVWTPMPCKEPATTSRERSISTF